MTVHDKLMTDLGQVVHEKSQKIGARRCKHVDHVSTSQAIAWRKWNGLKMTSSWIDSTSAAAVATVASNSASCAASKWHAWRCAKLELLFYAESCRFTMFNNVQLSVACSYAVMPSVATMRTMLYRLNGNITRSYLAWHVLLAPQLSSLSFRPLWQSLLLASSPLHWRPQQPFEPTSSCSSARSSTEESQQLCGHKFQNHRYRLNSISLGLF